ncbi:MAG: UvrB/UvrC motif-containing protein [Rhabdochlamydiaceae bacterium]
MNEQPLECKGCKKPRHIVYQEKVGELTICTETCADCPFLNQKLLRHSKNPFNSEEKDLSCGECHTSLKEAITNNYLGCSFCYSVFEKEIIHNLTESHQIEKRSLNTKKDKIHRGLTPLSKEPNRASIQLDNLKIALHEAITQEQYEQAAHIRDEIKHLEKEKT